MRIIQKAITLKSLDTAGNALEYLRDIIAENGPFDGILGYSEGASVAATYVLDEQKRFLESGLPRTIKCAVFITGWPACDPGDSKMLLADEYEDVIDIPTFHVLGSKDPFCKGSEALFNICDPDSRFLYDHGKGHIIPRDIGTVRDLSGLLREFFAKSIAHPR